MSSLLRLAKRALVGAVLAVVTGEAVLQLASLLVTGRQGGGWRPGAQFRVMCLGDSHTYGAGVPEADSYPANLQRILDERAPGRYAVLNLGVPGMNTAQVRNRLPLNVARFDPHVVVVWCGINDAWNFAEVQETPTTWSWWLDGFGSRSRLYRLVRVWWHDRKLERELSTELAREGTRFKIESERPLDPHHKARVRWGSRVEQIQHDPREFKADEAMEHRVAGNYAAMVEYARTANLRVIFVTYPLEIGGFGVANRGIRRVVKQYGVPVVEAGRALERVPRERQIWGWAAHPTGPIYAEIARDIADAVQRIVAE